MGDFFKPWRRKAGCVTLVVACVFMAAWVRSHKIEDLIAFSASKRRHTLDSSSSKVIWMAWGFGDLESNRELKESGELESVKESLVPKALFTKTIRVNDTTSTIDGQDRNLALWEIHEADAQRTASMYHSESFNDTFVRWSIYYWQIVVPLTLLSAYLLLSKPWKQMPGPTHV